MAKKIAALLFTACLVVGCSSSRDLVREHKPLEEKYEAMHKEEDQMQKEYQMGVISL